MSANEQSPQPTYRLHYGGQTFDLADVKAAVQLVETIEVARRSNAGGRLSARLASGGSLQFFLGPTTDVAISSTGPAADDATEA